MRGAFALTAIAIAAATGCGDDAPAMTADAGSAALPALTPCPAGWIERAAGGLGDLTVCEPWAGEEDCLAGELQYPGGPCVAVGSACPIEGEPGHPYPPDLPSGGALLFVRAGAAAGGDGSRGAPFGTIAEAVAAAAAGATIVLAEGTYPEVVTLPANVALRGACARGARIEPDATTSAASAVVVTGPNVELANLTVASPVRGIVVEPGASLRATDVDLARAVGCGIHVRGDASLATERVIVQGVTPGTEQCTGLGVWGVDQARLSLERTFITNCAAAGLVAGEKVGDSVSVTLRSVLIGRGDLHVPIVCGFCSLDAEGLVLERAKGIAILAAAADVRVRDFVVRDITSGATNEIGWGMYSAGSRVQLSRGRVERTREMAVGAFGGGISSLDVADLVVRDTHSRDLDGRGGRALVVDGVSTANVARVLFEDNREIALAAYRAGTTVAVTDATIRRTLPNACEADGCPGGGIGIGAYDGASIAIERFVVEESNLCGVQLARAGQLDLRTGIVAMNTIGACLDTEAYDLHRLMDGVRFVDNEAPVDTVGLYVPDPVTPLPP